MFYSRWLFSKLKLAARGVSQVCCLRCCCCLDTRAQTHPRCIVPRKPNGCFMYVTGRCCRVLTRFTNAACSPVAAVGALRCALFSLHRGAVADTLCLCLPHVAFRETGTFPLRCFYCIYGNLWSVAGMQIYIFIYFIGGVERITPFCCLTVKWVTVLYGGRKMYRIITVSCVDKAGQSWLYIDSLDNRGCHCIQNGTCIVWVCNVQRYKPGQDPYSMWSNYRGLQVLL